MYHLYTDMPLIEGVGDEVTIVFTILLLFVIICIAWISTNIQELPFFSVIVIEFTRRQNRNQVTTNTSETSGSSASSSSSEESLSEQSSPDEPVPSSSSANSQNEQSLESNSQISVINEDAKITDNVENCSIPKTENTSSENLNNRSETAPNGASGEVIQDSDDLPASETELRQRRVAFFTKKPGSSDTEIENSKQNSESKDICAENLSKSSSNADVKVKPEAKLSSENLNTGLSQNEQSESDEFNRLSYTNSSQSDRVRIRLKYLNETQRNVEASLDDTIEQFRRTHFAEELAADKLVRFIFNGQDLRNDSHTLQAYNIVDNSVIHCLITQANRQNIPNRVQDDEGFDIGMLMLPCFGLILCFTWYLRFEYRQFFSGTSTVCLIGITLLFIAAILATREHRRIGHQHVHVE